MKNLNLWIRRTHLYLSLTLLPWFLIYGISSIVFNHSSYFDSIFGDWGAKWYVLYEKEYSKEIPTDAELREVAKEILTGLDLPIKAFSVSQPNPNRLNIYCWDFWSVSRVFYFADQNRVQVENETFRLDHFLTRMHSRGGYIQDHFLQDLYAVIVDIFCIAMLTWIITGIYMWWKIKSVRWWGTLALFGGIISFTIFLALL